MSTAQYASKRGSGSEDCLISMVHDWSQNRNNGQSTGIVTYDSGDAYNSMKHNIIHDKCMHHLGFDMKAITMMKSVEYQSMVIVRMNNMYSRKMKEKSSSYYQGFPPSQFVWCMYINPLIMKIEKEKEILED